MKPWGSQSLIQHIFPVSDPSWSFSDVNQRTRRAHSVRPSSRQQREASGGPGGGNEPPVATRMSRNLDTEVRSSPAAERRLGVQSTMRAAALLPDSDRLRHQRRQAAAQDRWRRPSYPNTPRRPFVTDSLRRQSPVSSDRTSFELTRRFPNVRPRRTIESRIPVNCQWPLSVSGIKHP